MLKHVLTEGCGTSQPSSSPDLDNGAHQFSFQDAQTPLPKPLSCSELLKSTGGLGLYNAASLILSWYRNLSGSQAKMPKL